MKTDLAWLRLYALPALAVAGLIAFAIWMLDLVPPRALTFAAGAPDGAYHALAERYRDALAQDGIEVTILATAGSVANAEALATGRADVAFLQGGVNPPPDAGIEVVATTFLEPFWVFHAGALDDPANPAVWDGLRIAAGAPGSGARFAAEAVAQALDLPDLSESFVGLGGRDAASALLDGEVDVALFVAPLDAPYLQALIADPAVRPAPIRDVDALVRRLDFVDAVEIPTSGFDYEARRPPRPIELVAMIGRLAARPGLHPSLIDRLVNAAREIHASRDLITDQGQFPGVAGAALPMNPQAANLLGSPPSALYRFMPYWIVAQVNSFALLLVPLLVLLIPIFRIAPGLYQWRMRARVYRYYSELLDIDRTVMSKPARDVVDRLETRLGSIESDLVGMQLPPAYREYAYTMRVHIDLVRRRIASIRAATEA